MRGIIMIPEPNECYFFLERPAASALQMRKLTNAEQETIMNFSSANPTFG
jgi:hypothetical protein